MRNSNSRLKQLLIGVMMALLTMNFVSPAVYAAFLSGGDYEFAYENSYTHSAYSNVRVVGEKGQANDPEKTSTGFTYTVASCIRRNKYTTVAGSGTGTLKITNTTGTPKRVSFKWSFSYATNLTYYDRQQPSAQVTAGGKLVQQGERFSCNLAAGQEIQITATAHGTSNDDTTHHEVTVTVEDFLIEDANPVEVEIGAVTGAATTAALADETTHKIDETDTTLTFYGAGDTVSLTCETAAGYTMQGWMVDGTFVSGTGPYTYTVGNNSAKIYPVVLPNDYTGDVFEVNGVLYDTWDIAVAVALKNNSQIILRKNYSLPLTLKEQALPNSGGMYVTGSDRNLTYIVPEGVTFLIPYGDSDTGLVEPAWSRNIDECTFRNGGTSCTNAYQTLTVPGGTTVQIDANARLIVNAQVSGASNDNEGTVFGTYGKMIISGDMKVKGTLYARGYLIDADHTQHHDGTGTGLIEVCSGGSVYMPLQIFDYRGGNASSDVYNWIFPITQYKFQNIMLRTVYEYGASLYGQYFTSVSDKNWGASMLLGAQMTIGAKQLFGANSDCFVQLKNGAVITDYDYTADQLVISVDGSVSFNDLSVVITTSLKNLTVTTAGKEVPLPYGIGIKVLDGATIDLDKKIKMLPGSWVEIQTGGTVNVSGSIYLYDDTDYQGAWSYNKETTTLTVPGLINTNVTTWNNDAKIYVEGTLNISGVVMESPSHSGGVVGRNGGTINAAREFSTEGTIYEMAGANTDKVPSSWSGVTGLLAGLSQNTDDFVAFAPAGMGTYHTTDVWASDANAAWYQYTISVADGKKGITASSAAPTVGKTTYTESDITVGYAVKGGTFAFSVDKGMVFSDGTNDYLAGDPNTITVNADTVLHRCVAAVMNGGSAKYFQTLKGAITEYAQPAEGKYIQMVDDSSATNAFVAGTVLNLNGHTVTDVTATGTIQGVDSSSDGFKTPKGSLTVTGGTVATVAQVNSKDYVAVQEGNTYTFHRFAITPIACRFYLNDKTNHAHLEVKAAVQGDDTVIGKVKDLGFTITSGEKSIEDSLGKVPNFGTAVDPDTKTRTVSYIAANYENEATLADYQSKHTIIAMAAFDPVDGENTSDKVWLRSNGTYKISLHQVLSQYVAKNTGTDMANQINKFLTNLK